MRSKASLLVLFVGSLTFCVALLAVPDPIGLAARQDTTPKEDIKDAGKSTKNAAKKTGSATKKETKKVVNKSAQKTKDGANTVEDKTAPKQ
jgi:hypothetical protein